MKIQPRPGTGTGAPPAPRFSLLGYVWEVGHQIGFRYNFILIDLPVVKEADR